MKSEVYSWRVSTEIKTNLEHAARSRKISLSSLLDTAAREWLINNASREDDDEKQRRLHKAASKFLGVLASGNAGRSETVREAVRSRLRQRYGR
jgi:hypothetical protein